MAFYQTLTDDFATLNGATWTTIQGSPSVSGGILTVPSGATIDTDGNFSLDGDKGIIVIIVGKHDGGVYDLLFRLRDEDNDEIRWGETSYSNRGFYSYAGGKYSMSAGYTGAMTTGYKVYKLTLLGTSYLVERGDTLATLNESISGTLNSSIAGHDFFIEILGNTGSYATTVEAKYVYAGYDRDFTPSPIPHILQMM